MERRQLLRRGEWNKVDDVGCTRAVLDDLAKAANVDAKRVFATGISNGGIMCYRLASELSDRIAAIAPVSGTMGTAACNPKRPVSVMHFHGSDDKFVPFNGGDGERGPPFVKFFSVEHSIQAWVKADGCPEKPVIREEATKVDDGTTVQRKTYGPGKDGAGGGALCHPRRRPHLAGAGNEDPVPRQGHEEHFGQRPDVGVLQESSHEVTPG